MESSIEKPSNQEKRLQALWHSTYIFLFVHLEIFDDSSFKCDVILNFTAKLLYTPIFIQIGQSNIRFRFIRHEFIRERSRKPFQLKTLSCRRSGYFKCRSTDFLVWRVEILLALERIQASAIFIPTQNPIWIFNPKSSTPRWLIEWLSIITCFSIQIYIIYASVIAKDSLRLKLATCET